MRAPTPASLRASLVASSAGVLLPLVAAALSLPVLVDHLGLSRFGMLALLMAGLTYAGLLEIGMSMAVNYRLVILLRTGSRPDERMQVVRTALMAVLVLGLVAGACAHAAAPMATGWLAATDPAGVMEGLRAIRSLALAIPAVLVASVLGGVLSAHGHFVALNAVRVPVGILGYAGPALASAAGGDLVDACVILAVSRWLQAAAHAWQCRGLYPALWRGMPALSTGHLRALLDFGGWLAVSNVVGTLLVYADRFHLAALRSAEEVARYVVPWELATRIALLPAALLPVLFTQLVAHRASLKGHGDDLFLASTRTVGLACALPVALLGGFAPWILDLWMARRLGGDSAFVLSLLSAAVLANCVALVFYTQVQSQGRTDWLARLHGAELVAYLPALWWLASRLGIAGVAVAWALRVFVDAAILCYLASRDLPPAHRRGLWRTAGVILLFAAAVALAHWVASAWYGATLVGLSLFALWAWRGQLMAFWSDAATDRGAERGALRG